MRILHLTLGIPPLRNGGLPGYAYAVAAEEAKMGHDVCMLYPGRIGLINRRSRIAKASGPWDGTLRVFRIINPNYVAIPLGVKEPSAIVHAGPAEIFSDFLDRIRPDFIHVHTFMGFHKELFQEIRKRSVPCMFTTHDYYPICPKTSLIDDQNRLCSGCAAEKCAVCNAGAVYSPRLQYILQSEWYPRVRNLKLLTFLKKKRSGQKESGTGASLNSREKERRKKEYEELLNYQREMLSAVSFFHCSSTVAAEQYRKYIGGRKSFLLNITTGGIQDHRAAPHEFQYRKTGTVNIGFIGIRDPHKGSRILQQAGAMLHQEGLRFRILLYGDEYEIPAGLADFCESRGLFDHARLADVMKELDIVVVPSCWYETFGFATVEAVANSVPVLVSSRAGSRDVLREIQAPHEFEPNPTDLANLLRIYLRNPEKLELLREEQSKTALCTDMKEHTERLLKSAGLCTG